MSCWVLRAILTESSVGRAYASSREFVWRDCVPPNTAAKAWKATLTTLLSGCWAVREHPAVWVWNLSMQDSSFLALNRSFIIFDQSLRAALNLATSSRKV